MSFDCRDINTCKYQIASGQAITYDFQTELDLDEGAMGPPAEMEPTPVQCSDHKATEVAGERNLCVFRVVICLNSSACPCLVYIFNVVNVISISNSMVSSAIWKKHSRVSFPMTPKPAGRVQFGVVKKLTSACYFKTARETMLLLVDNIKGNIASKNTHNTTVLTLRPLPFTFSLKTLNLRPLRRR